MGISLEPAAESAFPAWDGFLLVPGVCPAARVQTAAHSTQTALGCSCDPRQRLFTAGDLPTQPGLSQKLVDVRVAGN